MKPLVIYHADCTDGFGAAFAAWLKLGDEAEYLPTHYNHLGIGRLAEEFGVHRLVDLSGNFYRVDGREVYLLDFSFNREQMDWLFTHAKRVVWLDHHKTAFEMWGDTNGFLVEKDSTRHITLDNNKSGALLAWEYFHPDIEVPMLIQHIDDRDRWQFKLKGSKELHAALASYKPWSFEQWEGIFKNPWGDWRVPEEIIMEGAAILRAAITEAEKAEPAGKVVEWRGPNSTKEHGFLLVQVIPNRGEVLYPCLGTLLYTHPTPPKWQPIETAPKSTADGRHVAGIMLLGFVPDAQLTEDQSQIDIIWWEPLLKNHRGGKGKWVASSFGESVEVVPTHWMPLPQSPEETK